MSIHIFNGSYLFTIKQFIQFFFGQFPKCLNEIPYFLGKFFILSEILGRSIKFRRITILFSETLF